VKRAFKYRFHPTPEQADQLGRTFGCVRLVYNKALEERVRVHATESRSMTYGQSSAALTAWKKTDELGFLNEVSSVPLQQALRHLQTAYTAFFAKRSRYPSFKTKRKSRASAEYTRSGFKYRDGRLTLATPRHERADREKLAKDRRALVRKAEGWFPSAKSCSVCGRLAECLPLALRMWTCSCGAVHDGDVNAARTILAAGLAER